MRPVSRPLRALLLMTAAWGIGRAAALWHEYGAIPPGDKRTSTVERALVGAHRSSPDPSERGTRRPERIDFAPVLRATFKAVPNRNLLRRASRGTGGSGLIRIPADADTPSPRAVLTTGGEVSPVQEPRLSVVNEAPIFTPTTGATQHSAKRYSISGWALVRASGARELSDAGQLGGSQAGIRGYYALGHSPVSLTARFSAPLADPTGKEAAFGVAVRPINHVPLTFIIEQRVAADRGGRNDLEVIAAGGLYDRPLGHRLTLSGYLQGGIVGVKRRDAFIDGSAEIEHPLVRIAGARLTLGGGAWGAAQPGVSRLDAGPIAALHFRIGAVSAKAEASYRVRMLGVARPATGPALSVGTDF